MERRADRGPTQGQEVTDQVIVIGPTPPPPHGVAVTTLHILDSLNDLGLLAAHLETRDDRPIHSIGTFDARNVWLGLRHAAQLLRLLARTPAKRVYLPISQGRWGFLRDVLFIWTAFLARRRVYVQLNGGHFRRFYSESGPLLRWIVRSTLDRVDQAWVLTPSLAHIFDGLVSPDRLRVVENVVEDPADGAVDGATRAPRGDIGPVHVLYLANLIPSKGCFDLIEALEQLRSEELDLRVRLVGSADPDVEEQLRAAAERFADSSIEIELVGLVTGPEKTAQYLWADLFAFPTWYPPEGQPLVLLEALAFGLPLVTTAHAGIPDTVRDGEEGLIVPTRDTAALAGGLRRLATDADLRAKLGANARRRYEERYRPEHMREQLARLFAET